jgi:signal peptidase
MIRRLRGLVAPIVLGGLLIVWFVLFRPASLGGSSTWVVVRGTSMLPNYQTGDLVIAQAASAYLPGDAVAYRVAEGEIGAGHIVFHRIIGGSASEGFDVQGDNNDAPDPWHPRGSAIVGRAWIVVPGFGAVIAWIHQPIIAAGIASALMVAFIVARPPAKHGGMGSGPASWRLLRRWRTPT